MIPVAEAKAELLSLVAALNTEEIPLDQALGRVLAEPVSSLRAQPPFPASAMDGYAVHSASPGETLQVIGSSAAGHRFSGMVEPGQAVRIFTGAVVPPGATRIVIQEDVQVENDRIIVASNPDTASYIRPAGADFDIGSTVSSPRRLGIGDISLLAAMNCATIKVYRKPVIAILATGDELVMPGETPAQDQIIATNALSLKLLFETAGATARILPIARDTPDSLRGAFTRATGADVLVTIGGASVGDHDLVRSTAQQMGLEQKFYKVAMRPGKPLMAGKLGAMTMIGLPGNPVSSIVCGHVFILPVIDALLGLPRDSAGAETAFLTHDLPANGPRTHYMRARVEGRSITIFDRQDSALLTVLARANALAIHPAHAPARPKGSEIEILWL